MKLSALIEQLRALRCAGSRDAQRARNRLVRHLSAAPDQDVALELDAIGCVVATEGTLDSAIDAIIFTKGRP